MLTLMLDTFASLAQTKVTSSKVAPGQADAAAVAIANLQGAR